MFFALNGMGLKTQKRVQIISCYDSYFCNTVETNGNVLVLIHIYTLGFMIRLGGLD